MQKKIALLVLPAMLVLSGCGVKPAVNNKIFLEDTLAHSEVFGGFESPVDLRVRKEGEAKASLVAPKIGYQINYDNDKLAIRFVAAIEDAGVKAYWRRGAAAPDGSIPQNKKFSDDGQEASTYYVELTDGDSTIKAGEGDFETSIGFVVYTVRNIPYTANKDSYVAAYLTLVDKEDSTQWVSSPGLAVKIEKKTNYKSANAFSFDANMKHHFLQGKIGGVENQLVVATEHDSGDNFASYSNLDLEYNDSFGSFYFERDTILQYFGFGSFGGESAGFFNQASASGYYQPKKSGNYNLFISRGNGNHTYTSANYFDSNISLWLKPGKWNADNARFAVYLFGGSVGEAWAWMEPDTKTGVWKYSTYNSKDFPKFIFVRENGVGTIGWDIKYNQSRDLSVGNLTGIECCFNIVDGDPWDENSNDYFCWYSEV